MQLGTIWWYQVRVVVDGQLETGSGSLVSQEAGVADLPFKMHSKPPLLAPATGLHLDLIHGGVEALYIPPLLGREDSCGLWLDW